MRLELPLDTVCLAVLIYGNFEAPTAEWLEYGYDEMPK